MWCGAGDRLRGPYFAPGALIVRLVSLSVLPQPLAQSREAGVHLFPILVAEDEFAWEESRLGHGMFTYCYSVQELSLGSSAAVALQPDNTFGPSLAIAAGELGCSLLTAGAQNPIVYFNGTGHLEVCGRHIDLFDGNEYMGLDEMRAKLRRNRDEVAAVIRPARPNLSIRGTGTDEERRARIRETVEFVRRSSEEAEQSASQ